MTALTAALNYLRTERWHTAELHRDWDRFGELADTYADATSDTERLQAGAEIADIMEKVADHLEASRLARATASLSPVELRRNAVEWRAGTMPVGP